MITRLTSLEVEVRVDRTFSSMIAIEAGDEIILSEILFDEGDGYRTFHPLLAAIDGVDASMPAVIAAGRHSIELKGEAFDGVGLLLAGVKLHSVRSVDVSLTASQLALLPQYYEDDGPPEESPLVAGAISGARYKDRLNKFRYEFSEGQWLQLGS